MPRRRLCLVCLVAPFDDSNFNEIILCVRAVRVRVCAFVCSLYLTPSLTLPVSLTEQCCIKISLKLFANGLNMLRSPPCSSLPPLLVSLSFGHISLLWHLHLWDWQIDKQNGDQAPLCCLLCLLLSLLFSTAFFLPLSTLSSFAHCHPSMCAILLLASPKNMFAILPLSVCLATLATPNCFARQTALRLRQDWERVGVESGRARQRERERERAKRARYNEAWLPRQQRQRQRNGDCDCLCLSSLCCSYLCSWCCYWEWEWEWEQ